MLGLQVLVEAVLDLGNGSTLELWHLGDVRPSCTQLLMHFEKQFVFFWGPVLTVDSRIEHVDPSLAALSTDPVGEVLSDTRPFLGSVLFDLLPEDLILFLCPEGVVRVHNLWSSTRRD